MAAYRRINITKWRKEEGGEEDSAAREKTRNDPAACTRGREASAHMRKKFRQSWFGVGGSQWPTGPEEVVLRPVIVTGKHVPRLAFTVICRRPFCSASHGNKIRGSKKS